MKGPLIFSEQGPAESRPLNPALSVAPCREHTCKALTAHRSGMARVLKGSHSLPLCLTFSLYIRPRLRRSIHRRLVKKIQ